MDYRPGAAHPDWDLALEALPADALGWFRVVLGQAVTGHPNFEDYLVVTEGGGENGKSTVYGAALAVLGSGETGYGQTASEKLLMGAADEHPTVLADLFGVRMLVIEETPEARRLDTQRLKRTIGTSPIRARRMRQDSFEFVASHSAFVATNHRPVVEETDHGTWRRLALLVFPFVYRKVHEAQPGDRIAVIGLRERLKRGRAQREAVLAWLVGGAGRWYQADQQLPELPPSVVAATREWRGDSDLVLSYLEDRVVFGPKERVPIKELFEDFSWWLEGRRQRPWSQRTFSDRLLGHEELVRHRVEKDRIWAREDPHYGDRMYLGMRLRNAYDPFEREA